MPTARRRKQAADELPASAADPASAPTAVAATTRKKRETIKPKMPVEVDVKPVDIEEMAVVAAAKTEAPPFVPTWQAARLKVPGPAQFPVLIALSFALSSLGYAILSAATGSEMAKISTTPGWSEVGTLTSWRVLELALGWFGGYDSLDIAALNVVSHLPSLYLVVDFYGISPGTAVTSLAVDVFSALLPVQLLRPLSGAHAGESSVPNIEVVTDIPIQIYTTVLSAAVYGVTVVSALRIILPKYLVLYFEGIPSVQPAYDASYLPLAIPVSLLIGFAARSFLFTPFAAMADTSPEDARLAQFNPASATLKETFNYNVWGYTAKSKVLLLRTAALLAATGVSTFVHCAVVINGVALQGAVAYAAVWVAAGLLVSVALGAVGGV